MKKRTKALLGLILIGLSTFAQQALTAQEKLDTSKLGFVNFLNMIPESVTSKITLDGKEIVPGGLLSGNESGWFAMPAKPMELSVEAKRFTNTKISVDLLAGATQLYVIYLDPVDRKKTGATPASGKIVIKEFPTFEPGRKTLRFVSLHPQEKEFSIMNEFITFRPGQIVQSPKWNGQGFTVEYRKRPIGEVLPSEGKESLYVFIAPDLNGDSFVSQAALDKLYFKR